MRNAKRYQRSTRERGKTMKGPKAVSWFSRCRAGLAATNGDEEPWTCPPHASMVRDRKLPLLPLVNPLCFSPLFPPTFSSFFFPLSPLNVRYHVQSLLLIRASLNSPLSFSLSLSFHDRKSSYPPILNCPTCFKPIYIYPLQNSDTTSIHIYYYYYHIRIRRRIKINKAPTFLSHPPRYRRSRIAETNVIVYCSF